VSRTSVLEAAVTHRSLGAGTIPSAADRITTPELGRRSAAPDHTAKVLYPYCVPGGATVILPASPTAPARQLVLPATSAPPAQ